MSDPHAAVFNGSFVTEIPGTKFVPLNRGVSGRLLNGWYYCAEMYIHV
jgi:hypothetical protein